MQACHRLYWKLISVVNVSWKNSKTIRCRGFVKATVIPAQGGTRCREHTLEVRAYGPDVLRLSVAFAS